MEYGWKDGSRIKLDPQIAGEYLDSLSISGPGDAREIVDAGRPTSSPIHSYFEWDNEIAGEEYRVIQGRKLGASLVEIKEMTTVIANLFADTSPYIDQVTL